MAVTIQDIANNARVSLTTVSAVINGRSREYRLSKDTNERVLKIAEKLGYVPNLNARSIRQNKTLTIGVIVTSIQKRSLAHIVKGIESISEQNGYKVIISLSSNDAERERVCINDLLSRRVDGLIVIPVPSGETIPELKQLYSRGTPVVLCEAPFVRDIDVIDSNVEEGSYQATQYLIKLGHRKIGICSPKNWLSTRAKYQGYRRALEDYSLSVPEKFHIHLEETGLVGGEEAARIILKMDERLTAVIFHNDSMASTAMDVLWKSGLRIPEDISIIGFDNIPLSGMLRVPLTTLKAPFFEIGERAASIVVEKAGRAKRPKITESITQIPHTVRFAPTLVVRESCCPRHDN